MNFSPLILNARLLDSTVVKFANLRDVFNG